MGFWSRITSKFAEKQTSELFSMKFWSILLYIITIIIIVMEENQLFKTIWFYHIFDSTYSPAPLCLDFSFTVAANDNNEFTKNPVQPNQKN